jgi:hypothetical protein
MAEVGEVHPDLVGSAGSQLRLNQREPPKLLQRPHDRVGRAPARARRQRRPTGTGARAADPARNQDLAGEIAAHQRQIATLYRVSAELALELLSRGVGQGQHQHARCVAVESVNHQHPPVPPGASLQLGRGAGEHSVLVAFGRRVHQQAGRLVDYQHVGVQVQDLDGRSLRCARTSRQVWVVFDSVAGSHLRARVGDYRAVDEHVTEEHLTLCAGVGRTQAFLRRSAQPARALRHAARVSLPRWLMWTAPRLPG